MSAADIAGNIKIASNPCAPECPHARVAEDSLKILESSPAGLSQEEANARLQTFGPNALPQPKLDGPGEIFLRQFLNPLTYYPAGGCHCIDIYCSLLRCSFYFFRTFTECSDWFSAGIFCPEKCYCLAATYFSIGQGVASIG